MRYLRKLGVLLVLAAFAGATSAYAGVDEDKDKDKDKKKSADSRSVLSLAKSQPGDCNLGSASQDLDVNNVRARLFNNGGLFWRGSGNVYTVPKAGAANAIFASGIWIGGLANGTELRFAGTAYGPWEFWPGPLNESGNPPADCSQYDRIFNVYRTEIDAFLQNGMSAATPDILDWPADLGAPFVDVNEDGQYRPEDGDYPEVLGDQTAWWIMNDAGNTKQWSATAEIGLEVQVTAFAFRTADALNNTTFYRYKLIHKGDDPLLDTYFGIWSDPDLGDASNDYVGSDTLLGLGYVYNGTDFDAGVDGYGSAPPAAGYDYFQGPLIPCSEARPCSEEGGHTDPDGTFHPDSVRIQMSKFVYYDNADVPYGNPDGDTREPYQYLQGIWRDGTVMTFGGNGYGGTIPTDNMFPGNPVQREFWSEENTDGAGSRNTPADRRFIMSSGPFTLRPGDVQEIVYGVVWSQAPTRLGSVAQLRFDDVLAQGAYNFNFQLPSPPDEPQVVVEPLDNAVAITWNNPPTSNNYLNSYDRVSPFLIDPTPPDSNVTFTFEGYKIYQYASPTDQEGEVIAVLDVANNVTQIIDEAVDPLTGAVITQLVANGADTGVRNYYVVDGLTNYQSYTFGVQAYAYNPNSAPRIYASPINKFTIQPQPPSARRGGTSFVADPSTQVASARTQGTGDAVGVFAEVADPAQVTGDTYEVRIYQTELPVTEDSSTTVTTYDIVNATSGQVALSGEAYIASIGENLKFGDDIALIDGLSFTVKTAQPGFNFIHGVEYAGEATLGDNVWHALNNAATYYASATGSGALSRLERFVDFAVPRDFEFRFTEEGGYGVYAFTDDMIATTPFEIWDIGIATPDDPSDDVRMIPFLLENVVTADAWGWATGVEGTFGYPMSDAVYFMDPESPDGYENFAEVAANVGAGGIYPFDSDGSEQGYYADFHGGFVYPIGRFTLADFDQDGEMPPPGTTIRFVTFKPLAPGDVFAINSDPVASVTDDSEAAVTALDEIGIVPNPYKGASAYEVTALSDEVRFTGLPTDGATIRVFSLSGDLIRSMNLSAFNNRWDLTTQEGLPLASGMYLVHVETDAGERVLKFGVVKKRIQLDLF